MDHSSTVYGFPGEGKSLDMNKSNQSSRSGLGNLFASAKGYLGKTVYNIASPRPLLVASKGSIMTILTVFTATLSLGTFGLSKGVNNRADFFTAKKYAKFILPNVYLYLIKIVNPNINSHKVPRDHIWISSTYARPIFVKAEALSLKDTTFSKHFVSRGCYVLAGLVSVVTKAADLALGLLAAALSILPFFGRRERINDFAFHQLGALSLVDDLCLAARGAMNPQQFLGTPRKFKEE